MIAVTESMLAATKATKVRILRAAIVENLKGGTMARVREAAEVLQRLAPQSMTMRVVRGRKVVAEIPVVTVNEASAIWCAYRDARNFGASGGPRALIFVDGVERGHVSYNGRVWEGTVFEWKSGARPIYDPSDEAVAS